MIDTRFMFMQPVVVEPKTAPTRRQPHVPWQSRERDPWDDLSGNGRVLIERLRPPTVPGPKRKTAYFRAVVVLWRIEPEGDRYKIIKARPGFRSRYVSFNSKFEEIDWFEGREVELGDNDLMWVKMIAEDPEL